MAYVLVLVKTRESWLQLYRVRLLSGWAGSQGGLDLRTTHRLQGKRERWGLKFKPHSSEWGRRGKEEGNWIVYLRVKEKRKRGRGGGKDEGRGEGGGGVIIATLSTMEKRWGVLVCSYIFCLSIITGYLCGPSNLIHRSPPSVSAHLVWKAEQRKELQHTVLLGV